MSRNLLLALGVTLLLSAPVSAQVGAKGDQDQPPPGAAPAPMMHSWTLRNGCHESIRIAVGFYQPDGKMIVKGWIPLAPQGEAQASTYGEWMGYFAQSVSGRYSWGDPNGARLGVDFAQDFIFVGDGTGQNVPIVGFRWINVVQEWHTTVSCQ